MTTISRLRNYLKKLSKHKLNRRNETINMRVKQIPERQQRKSLRPNAGLFEINKIAKPLVRLITGKII